MSVGGFLVMIALVLGLIFPYFAVAYAESSISPMSATLPPPETNPSVPAVVEPTVSPSQPAQGAPTRDDLGVRSLPLLSDSTRALWLADPTTALIEANERVFGTENPFGPYEQLRDRWDGDWNEVMEIMDEGDYVDWLAGAPELITPMFETTPPAEGDVLDLAALLVFLNASGDAYGAASEYGTDLQFHAFVAVALLQSAARTFDTCDSHLAYAHALTLDWPSWPDAEAQMDEAVAACGDDPTAAIARNYLDLARATETPTIEEPFDYANFAPPLWAPFIDTFQEVQTSHADNPAGWIGEGDTYLSAAFQMQEQGAQPFAVQAFFQAADTAYTQALTLTTSADVQLSLARAKGFLGNHEEAEAILQTLPDALQHSAHGISLRREILLERDDFKGAAAVPDAEPASPTAVTYGPWSDLGFDPNELTGQQDVTRVDDLLYSQDRGGGSITWNYGHTPSFRMAEDGGAYPFQLDMLILTRDWVPAQKRYCTNEDGYPDDNSPPCLIVWVGGEPDELSTEALDYWQNLLRTHGLMDQARQLVSGFVAVDFPLPTAKERLGEIEFLEGRWDEAAAASRAAIQDYELAKAQEDPDYPSVEGLFFNNTGPAWAGIRYATALRKLGKFTEALDALSSLNNVYDDNLIDFFAAYERAAISFDKGNHAEVLTLTESTIAIGREVETEQRWTILTGAEAQLGALSALELGEFDTARDYATQAVATDPYNPLFQEALAEAERKAGGKAPTEPTATDEPTAGSTEEQTYPASDPEGTETGDATEGSEVAIAAYREALALNPSLFSTWNNLGALLFETGESDEALQSFEQAVSLRPDYATAWFNVGVAEAARPGFLHFLRSQGALGKAGLLDAGFKDEGMSIAFDEEIYDSGLDLSKQLPANWQLTDTVRSRPTLLALGILVMVGARIVWALGSTWMVGNQLERTWRNASRSRRWAFRLWFWQPTPLLTSVVTLGALLMVTGVTGLRESLLVGVLIAAALALHAILPRLMTAEPIRQGSFLPGSFITAGLAFVGVGFAPPAPFATTDNTLSARAHRIAIVALALVVVTYGVAAWMTGVPTARSLALAAMVLISSAMLPIPPLDGSGLGLRRWFEVLASMVVGAGTVALALGVV